jgi:prepilin-type N-terminal cleavage/methylation domain-containing protein
MNTTLTQPLPHACGVTATSSRAGAPVSRCVGSASPVRSWAAFTLIELLVVISIIGVLASLSVGLTGVATRKSKESRIKAEMTKIINAIENYKSALGFYPPDHAGFPSTNQLFYELSGTIYTNFPSGQFSAVGRQEPIPATAIESLFNSRGFANAARDRRDLKFSEVFKPSQFKTIGVPVTPPGQVDILAVPVDGPKDRRVYDPSGPVTWVITVNKTRVNPWLYVSTSPTNNPDRFDLWTEVAIGGKAIRFSNWEKDPVVLSP